MARNVIGVMLASEESWECVAEFVEGALRIKKVDLDAQSATRAYRALPNSGTQKRHRLAVLLDVGNMGEHTGGDSPGK